METLRNALLARAPVPVGCQVHTRRLRGGRGRASPAVELTAVAPELREAFLR